MSELEMMVDAVLLDPMATARARARQGQRVIGYVGAEIPVEVILAAGAFPLRLPGRVQATDQADRYLESRFTPDLRSIAEQYLTFSIPSYSHAATTAHSVSTITCVSYAGGAWSGDLCR